MKYLLHERCAELVMALVLNHGLSLIPIALNTTDGSRIIKHLGGKFLLL